MSKVLFNIDDLALILVISSSLIFITILLSDAKERHHKIWLALFLACIACGSANVILYWSPIIRSELSYLQPHTFIIARTVLLAAAPALYIYSKSLIYKDFKLPSWGLFYFSPALIYALFIPVIYLSMGPEQIARSALDYQLLYSNKIFWSITWLQHCVQLAYGFVTLKVLMGHRANLRQVNSDTEGVDGTWLLIMVVGFVNIWIIQAASQLFHEFHLTRSAQALALFGNYLLFTLVNVLVIFSLTRSTAKATKIASEQNQAHEYTEEQVQRLEKTIVERKPYLKSDLTLEELSKITSIPQRTLSGIINRHHDKNFFEYINEHRVNRSAELLLTQTSNLSILDIMEESGFNSKSAFNRFFKKSKGMTPTQYKSLHKDG